ncbi:MAG: hypothetical protein MI924_14815 [Chloroflexales bacterium]|nr:hypothetical protein [Chloroflexales bacterium]
MEERQLHSTTLSAEITGLEQTIAALAALPQEQQQLQAMPTLQFEQTDI